MSAPTLPVVIRNVGIFVVNSVVYYFDQTGAKVKTNRGIEIVKDDFFGAIQNRAKGSPVVDITFTPTGLIRNLAATIPFSGSGMNTWYAGQSIFNGSGFFIDKGSNKSLFAKAGILKPPTMYLHPTKNFFGPMTVRCINDVTLSPTNAAVLKTISTTAFTDVSFDQTKIKGDVYSAALGSRSTPYSAMGGRDGFTIEPIYNTYDVEDANVGTADTRIAEVGFKVMFAPNNLTEAQLDGLANWEGTNAMQAGDDVSKLSEDLVITGGPVIATLHSAGVVSGENGWGAKLDRNGNVEFVAPIKFTTGVPQSVLDLTVNI